MLRPGTRNGAASARCRMLKSAAAAALLAALAACQFGQPPFGSSSGASQQAASNGPCGSTVPPVALHHIIVVMLENRSFNQVIGNAAAPYQTHLAAQCGVATAMFGATHSSAANYLAMSAGEYPGASARGCSSVGACADRSDNLYHQLDAEHLTWRAYAESMPRACAGSSATGYKIGHNPAIFYRNIPAAECQANDVPVASLTASSGPLYAALASQALPALTWITPNKAHDGEGSSNRTTALQMADSWLAGFLAMVEQSPSYRSGDTLVLVTYDEGFRRDSRTGENCTDASRDMPVVNGVSAHQDSCHVPFFVVYPYTPAGAKDGTFFDHYSVTKTVEDVFRLPHLAHAADPQTSSLRGHFGIP